MVASLELAISKGGSGGGSGGEILTACEVSLPCPHILYLSLSPNLIIKFSCPGSNLDSIWLKLVVSIEVKRNFLIIAVNCFI